MELLLTAAYAIETSALQMLAYDACKSKVGVAWLALRQFCEVDFRQGMENDATDAYIARITGEDKADARKVAREEAEKYRLINRVAIRGAHQVLTGSKPKVPQHIVDEFGLVIDPLIVNAKAFQAQEEKTAQSLPEMLRPGFFALNRGAYVDALAARRLGVLMKLPFIAADQRQLASFAVHFDRFTR